MKHWSMTVAVALTATIAVVAFLVVISRSYGYNPALAEASSQALAVTSVTPSSTPNGVDTPITITGTGFTAGLSGTVVITPPTVRLDNRTLTGGWVSSTTLTTTVPAGMDPGVYTVTVTNPDGQSGSLPSALTVTQGIGVWTTGGPYGGEVRDLVQNPVTRTTLYASVGGSGVFLSDDAAGHWRPVLINSSPIRMSIAPDAGAVYYSGVFDLYRSRDGGSVWERISPSNPLRQEFYPYAHPVSPTVVYLGASASLNRPLGPGEEGGLFLSTDYGSTWVTMTVGLTDTHVTALAFHPEDPARMVAATRNGNVFTSSDAGATWTWAALVGSHIERLAINPFGAHEVWAITSSPIAPMPRPHLYRSLDPGLTTWISVTMTTNPGAPAWFEPVWSLTFHPTISGTIWAAAGRSLGGNGFVSTDGGLTWSATGPSLPQAWSGTMAFVIDPATPNVMYAGTVAFGTYKSSDGGTTWTLSNEGLAGVTPEALAVSPANPNEAYAATPMGLLKTTNGGHSWQTLGVARNGFPWRGSVLAVDPFTSTRVYLGSGCPAPCIKIGEGGGSSWHAVTLTVPSNLSGWSGDTFAIAPSPAQPGRLLAGATYYPPDFDYSVPRRPLGGIYASDDYGETWTPLTTSQPISGVVEFAYDPVNPQVVYAATEGTGLLKSTDGGSTWQALASWPGNQDIWSVVVDPADNRRIYAHDHPTSQQPTTTVALSPDGGSTWTPVAWGEAMGGPVTLRFTPPPTSTLYAGTYTGGLSRRTSDGQGWERVRGVPETGSVNALAAGKDLQQVALYVGVSAGLGVTSTQTAAFEKSARTGQAESQATTAMGAGVYRLVTRLPVQRVYLPALFKQYAR